MRPSGTRTLEGNFSAAKSLDLYALLQQNCKLTQHIFNLQQNLQRGTSLRRKLTADSSEADDDVAADQRPSPAPQAGARKAG